MKNSLSCKADLPGWPGVPDRRINVSDSFQTGDYLAAANQHSGIFTGFDNAEEIRKRYLRLVLLDVID